MRFVDVSFSDPRIPTRRYYVSGKREAEEIREYWERTVAARVAVTFEEKKTMASLLKSLFIYSK